MPHTDRSSATARLRLLVACLLTLLLTGTAVSSGPAAAESPGDQQQPPAPDVGVYRAGDCAVAVPPAPGGPIRCGTIEVPARYDGSSDQRIELAVAVIPAAQATDAPPLVVLGGGPGEPLVAPALTGLATILADPAAEPGGFVALARSRDVVFLDQRGAGLSSPSLTCPEVIDALSSATLPPIDTIAEGYRSCRQRLVSAGVDLGAFNTTNDAEDIDQARQALGYDRIDLFGTSYGARLALQVARDHSDGLAHLVLSSPVPAETNFVADAAQSYDRALRALSQACTADDACRAILPDLRATLDATIARLQETPAQVPVTDPATGATETIPVDGYTLDSIVYFLFYLPGGPEVVPTFVASAAEGDFDFLADLLPSLATPFPTALGQQASFLCSEEAVDQPPALSAPGESLAAQLFTANSPVLGPNLARVCDAWDVEPAPQRVFEPIRTTVPTLIVAGRFDQITPPRYGRAIEAALPNDTYVEVRSVGHSPLLNVGPCGFQILDDFLTTAEPGSLDTTCATSDPAFVIPPAATPGPPTEPARSPAGG